MKKSFSSIVKRIKKAKNIGLFCHQDPDFDCLSSMNALAVALKRMGKKADMYTHRAFNYKEKQLLDDSMKIGGFDASKYNLLIAVDCNNKFRLGEYGDAFANFPNTIYIDHHPINELAYRRGDYVDPENSSCCEIIYRLIKAMHVKVTPKIATILYTGLFTDSGNFTNLNTNHNSFLTAAKLVKDGANCNKVSNVILRQIRQSEMLIKKDFYNKIEYHGPAAIVCITMKDLEAADATKDDCGTFSTKLNCIDGVKMGIRLLQLDTNLFDGSFRSKDGYEVNKIAAMLGGGGHKLAAGCQFVAQNMAQAKKMLIDAIDTYLKGREND